MIVAVWRVWCLCLWFATAAALTTVVIAGVVLLVISAALVGAFMPSRTIRGQLARLSLNVGEAVALVNALRPD